MKVHAWDLRWCGKSHGVMAVMPLRVIEATE